LLEALLAMTLFLFSAPEARILLLSLHSDNFCVGMPYNEFCATKIG